MRQISEQRGAPGGLIYALPHMAVEVAIGALRHAKWPVDVERQWIGKGHERPYSGKLAKVSRARAAQIGWRDGRSLIIAAAMSSIVSPQRPFLTLILCLLMVAASHGPAKAGVFPTAGGMRDEDMMQSILLRAHNDERIAHGLPPLAWSADLANAAGRSAAALIATGDPLAAHRRRGVVRAYGENLWLGSRGAYDYAHMVSRWLDERRLYANGAVPNISNSGNWADAGHYSQIIWRTTTRIGCAIASSDRLDVLICQYDPPGNVVGYNALTGTPLIKAR